MKCVPTSICALWVLLLLSPSSSRGADAAGNGFWSGVEDYFSHYFERVAKTQAEQPHWATPVVTVTPRLEQEFRYDQIWQSQPRGTVVDSFGGGKGLELIPTEHTEIIIGVPAWQERHGSKPAEGWADQNFLLKYRLLSANEENGNYILTLFMGMSVNNGDDVFTKEHMTYSPAVAFGKGWGDFDIQTTAGVTVPDVGTDALGTPVAVNTAFQYHFWRFFWPEVEVNYTWYPNGPHTGLNQAFVTPGLVLGRFPIWERLALTVGAGYQIALTSNPTYNNQAILSVRLPF